jgi:hypothetical protein
VHVGEDLHGIVGRVVGVVPEAQALGVEAEHLTEERMWSLFELSKLSEMKKISDLHSLAVEQRVVVLVEGGLCAERLPVGDERIRVAIDVALGVVRERGRFECVLAAAEELLDVL